MAAERTEMSTIEFTVLGIPQGKQRARSGRTRDGRPVHYTPEKTRAYEDAIRLSALAAAYGRAFDGYVPCAVTIDIVCPIPASWSPIRKEEALLGNTRPIGKPDVDNVSKAILDACNGVLWRDDSQVVEMHLAKRYGPEPQVVVTVRAADRGWSEVQQKEIGL